MSPFMSTRFYQSCTKLIRNTCTFFNRTSIFSGRGKSKLTTGLGPSWFSKTSLKEMKKFFGHIPGWYVESVYDLFYFAAVALLATYGTDTHSELLSRFQEFLSEGEIITGESVKEKEETIKNNPEIDVNLWIRKGQFD
jgi:hypothetical protein